MPFFENARNFEIKGGNFLDVKGNQNNYHYDQSLNVSGQGNSAVYSHGSYHRGGDSHINNNGAHMTAIGQGPNANINLGVTSIPINYSPPQPNYGPQFDQSYAQLQANAQPMAQSYGYGASVPPNGMFNHSTGHVNQPFHSQQQPSHFANGIPPPSQPVYQHPSPPPQQGYNQHPNPVPQPVYNQHPTPAPQQVYNQHPAPAPQPVYNQQPAPAPPQTSIHSAPPSINVPLIQVNQSMHQRNPSQTNAMLSPTMVPLPSSTPSTPPPPSVNHHQTTAQSNAFLGATVPMPSPSASSLNESASGTTLVQSLPSTTSPPVFPSPTPTVSAAPPSPASVPAAAPSSITASASSTSAPAAMGQPEPNSTPTPAFSEFPELQLLPGATVVSIDQEEGKKKKKKNIFSRMFKKTPKNKVLAANA